MPHQHTQSPEARKHSSSLPAKLAGACLLLLIVLVGLPGAAALGKVASPVAAVAKVAATDPVPLPSTESLPASGETYAGSKAYMVSPSEVMDSYISRSQSGMQSSGIDVLRLVGLRKGDVLLQLKSGNAKRISFYERGGYHELNGDVALGSLVLTSLKDGKLQLGTGPDDYYALTSPQQQMLLNEPVAGEGISTTLTFGDLQRAGILNTDKGQSAQLRTRYEGKLITEGRGFMLNIADTSDANFQQQLIDVPNMTDVTGFQIPKSAYDTLMKLFNNDLSAMVGIIGLPVTPYFAIETNVGDQPKKIGVMLTERQVLTFNPDNPADSEWQIGLFGSHLYDAISNGKEATATPTPMATATSAPTPETGLSYDHPLAELPQFAGFQIDFSANGKTFTINDPRKFALAILKGASYTEHTDELAQLQNSHKSTIENYLYFKTIGTYIDANGTIQSLVTPISDTLDMSKKISIKRTDALVAGTTLPDYYGGGRYSVGVVNGQLQINFSTESGWSNMSPNVIGIRIATFINFNAHLNDTDYSFPDSPTNVYFNHVFDKERQGTSAVDAAHDLDGVFGTK